MKINYLNSFTETLIMKGLCKNEDKEIVSVGIYLALEVFFNIITTLCIGLLFDMVLESLVFLCAFAFIRIYAGGYHCSKSISCYLLSIAILLSALIIIKNVPKEVMLIVSFVFCIINIPVFVKLVPVETKNKPLDQEEKNYYAKKAKIYLLIEYALIISLFLFDLDIWGFIISLGSIVCTIMVLAQIMLNKIGKATLN